MKKFFQDDEGNLITFLRKHRPLPPKEKPYLENQVIDLINQTSQGNFPEKHLTLATVFSVFSGTIALGLAVIWRTSLGTQQVPQIAIEQDIIETFLINSWENTLNEQTVFLTDEQGTNWFFSTIEEKPQVLSHSQ